jgi:hypothetical protein
VRANLCCPIGARTCLRYVSLFAWTCLFVSLNSCINNTNVAQDTPPTPSQIPEPGPGATATKVMERKAEDSLNQSVGLGVGDGKPNLNESNISIGIKSISPSPAWEGDNLRGLRAKQSQLQIYKQVRRSLMMGERNRVRHLRQKRAEMEERERNECAERQQREALMQHRLAEEQMLERERQMLQQAALAVNLEAERARQAKMSAPQRAKVEKQRYREALRCQILQGASSVAASHIAADAVAGTSALAAMAVCPCVPPRSMSDARVWLCASNCPLKDNPKAYHKLIMHLCSDPKAQHAPLL